MVALLAWEGETDVNGWHRGFCGVLSFCNDTKLNFIMATGLLLNEQFMQLNFRGTFRYQARQKILYSTGHLYIIFQFLHSTPKVLTN